MRPQVLTVSAFGPYAGEITIDFERLGTQGLYLITGDTGAEKQAFLMLSHLHYMEKTSSNCSVIRRCFFKEICKSRDKNICRAHVLL